MITLSRFLTNPFDDKNISTAELLAFTTDHEQRLIANNPGGELTPRITATQSALQLVADCAGVTHHRTSGDGDSKVKISLVQLP